MIDHDAAATAPERFFSTHLPERTDGMRILGSAIACLVLCVMLTGCYEELDSPTANTTTPPQSQSAGSQTTADRMIDGGSQPALGKARDSAKDTIGALEDRSQQLADQIDSGGFDDS